MKTKLMALMLLAGGAMFAQTRFSVGVNIGGNRGYYTQVRPGPGYTWVDGYWSHSYGRRNWVPGYWAPPVRNTYRFDRYRRDFDRHNRHDRH